MFLDGKRRFDRDAWLHLQATPRYNTWLGLSFERLCFAHIHAILKGLGITGTATNTYALLTPDAQMDMVIERADKVTSLCEMKYSSRPYAMSAEEAKKIRHREDEIAASFPTQKQVLVSLVSNRLPKKNEYYNSVISSNLTLENLFDD